MISHGYRKRGCGIVLVKRVKNPIRLAREMLVRGGESDGGSENDGGGGGAQGHCVLSGKTVEDLAEKWNLEMVDESYFWTRKRWDEHKRGLNGGEMERYLESDDTRRKERLMPGEGWDGKEYLPQGTVGCVALDRYGTLCVATSTGGLTNKLSGRIGDTPTIGAGFWAEEWEEPMPMMIYRQPAVKASVAAILPRNVLQVLGDCFPTWSGYTETNTLWPQDSKASNDGLRAVAMSGTGNGDSFLRLAATRTAAAIARFAPQRSLASAIRQIAGPGGELQQSASNRWGKTGEGEGGIIGIELVNGVGKISFDFNCGGMFRSWIDDNGNERVMVFREEYEQ